VIDPRHHIQCAPYFATERYLRSSTVMRRAITDTALSAAAVGVLIMALVSADARVREQIALTLSPGPAQMAAGAGQHLQMVAVALIDAVRDQSIAHAPLVILTVAAAALLVFMSRT
jgi:hypothetical protein